MNTRWLIKNWFRVGFKFSWKLSFETLISLLYFIPCFRISLIYKIIQKKHEFVIRYLKNHFSYLLEKYKTTKNTEDISFEHYIWVMWWQGYDNAPDLVKMCINSIKINSNGATVVIITKDNYKDYANIPDYIIQKHNEGIISFAQLSDIMRIFLLSEHGGLWLDSTIFVSQPIPENIFDKDFYSLHTQLEKTPFVQNNRIHCFVLGGKKGAAAFLFERDLLSDYWKTHDVIIDYYLLDYSFMLQYWNLDFFRSTVDNLDYTSKGLYDLVGILNQPLNRKQLEQILSDNLFSKLVWNKKYDKRRVTNYHYLLSQVE